VHFDAKPAAPRWVIPGFIGHGVVIFAGAHGAGKTTALVPLSMLAAGLHGEGDPLAPRHWRHVVYVTEDVEQARRILAGLIDFAGLHLDMRVAQERFHLVEARRLNADYVVQVGVTYRQRFARTVDGVELLPLVVFDTKSAVLEMVKEEDNSEASAIMAALKQSFEGLPCWLIGHVSKANLTRADVVGLSLRGASAFEADAHQVLYLIKEADQRYLVRGKTRFEGRWPELLVKPGFAEVSATDEFGHSERVFLRWGIASPPEQSRKETQEQTKDRARKADAASLRDAARNAVETAWLEGFPLNREGVKAKVKRRATDVKDCIENLLSERWLHEVTVPANDRTNSRRSTFLVNLSNEEHDAIRRGGELPPAKLIVPKSWKKPGPPSVPEVEDFTSKEPASANKYEA
jgi:hypothetical protein